MPINIITNEVKYSSEIVKLAESILDKSINNIIRINATQCLVDLYSQMDNIEMAEHYCKQLPSDLLLTQNVMKTRYLKDEKLLTSIQMNICDLVSEIGRESEFVIYNNRMKMSNEYKKEYLERLIKIDELVFVKDTVTICVPASVLVLFATLIRSSLNELLNTTVCIEPSYVYSPTIDGFANS